MDKIQYKGALYVEAGGGDKASISALVRRRAALRKKLADDRKQPKYRRHTMAWFGWKNQIKALSAQIKKLRGKK